jgi:hypothetical protein
MSEEMMNETVGETVSENTTEQVDGVVCPICGKVCKNERGLKKHITQAHKKVEEVPETPAEDIMEDLSENDPQDSQETLASALSEDASLSDEEETLPTSYPTIKNTLNKITSIPVGSVIELNGQVFWQQPATYEFEYAIADHIQVVVVGIETSDNGDVYLMLRATGGQALWSVLQSDVLTGVQRLVKLAPVNPPTLPANGQRKYEEPKRTREDELREDLPVFNQAIQAYLSSKELFDEAKKDFEEDKKKVFPLIEKFVMKFGEDRVDNITEASYKEYICGPVTVLYQGNGGIAFVIDGKPCC